ncbi:ubiE/COQ5 methyltransferase family [Phytophthora infestans]|uniref:UbiE/COQ5 methyltransferase family n=1 Tax=Phytophthora infestans TaxID=4787 RepID=A0A8S9UA58_PHYIN|nr:ubiE/COQ5 methyltransferase family [Phytophthora infestans]
MNDFISGGMHRIWKDSFVDTLHPVGPLKCLDVAGGTGVIAFRIAEQLSKSSRGTEAPTSPVTHVDRAIKEAYRVLKPGGRFMCMEFSQVPPTH